MQSTYTTQNDFTVMSMTLLVVVAATFLQTRAFDTSLRANGLSKGETTHPDFFNNLQTVLMQLLGLYTTMIPALKHPIIRYPWWIWCFAAGSFVCSVSSVGIFFWFAALSPLIAFVGACLQAFITLQLVWLINENEKKVQIDTAERKTV